MIWTTKLDDLSGGKVLYANGCSFTIGDELANPKSQAFPTLLGNNINCDFVVNQARCGASNHEILRKTMDFLLEYIHTKEFDVKDLTVVIGWSLVSRHECYDEGWKGITPNSVSSAEDLPYYYYGLLQSNEQDMLRFLWQVNVLQSFLKKYNINYFFFKIDAGQHIMWNQTGQEIIDGYDLDKLSTMNYLKEVDINRFPSIENSELTFREFALKYGALKPDYHPDEKSHELFAEYIEENLYE